MAEGERIPLDLQHAGGSAPIDAGSLGETRQQVRLGAGAEDRPRFQRAAAGR